MTIIVLDGQGGGIGRALIAALLPQLPEGAQLLCVGTNAMATAAMLKAGAQRGATGENAVRWAAEHADVLVAPIALVLKDSMMGEVTAEMAACVAQAGRCASSCPQSAAAPMWPGRTAPACSPSWRMLRSRQPASRALRFCAPDRAGSRT